MNTNKLKSFAQIARRILMEGVSRRITYYGFDAKGKVIDEPIPVAGGVIIREEIIDDATVPAKWQALRTAIQRHGVQAVMEEAAYTWFNRLMAMQILAKNNYDPTQLEYESAGSVTPVILARARRGMISYLGRTEQKRVQPLLGDYQNEQKAFAILLTGYCHHHQLLNRIFGRLDDYTELLLPDNILAESGLIYLLNTTDAITNEDYRQVELIGWLYQFYISEKKDQVFASFKKNQKAEAEDIPAATQIFTPKWIVKYMVQNTVGRIWLDHRPESPLRQKMKYLVEAPNTEDAAEVSPSRGDGRGASFFPPLGELEGGFLGLRLLDPACGSGHILVEGFFHLYDIYEEEYYMPAEAVEKILQHNLFGLDIDLRAAQLAQFAVLLAAATKYPDILKKEITPHIYAMPEAAAFSREEILDFLGSEGTQHEKVLTRALDLMQQAKNLGSIMQFNVTPAERQFFIQRMETLQTDSKNSLLVQSLLNKIQPFLQVLFIMTDRYEAIAANPPYMGSGNMNNDLKNYINDNYPISKSDLMTVFMELAISLTKQKGQIGMINLPSWMFLSSFEKLRKKILSTTFITSLIQNGRGIFGSDFGSVSFCFSKENPDGKKGVYRRLFKEHVKVDSVAEKEKRFLDKSYGFFTTDQTTFKNIPGSPLGYWLSQNFLNLFKNKPLSDFYDIGSGLSTSDNDRFIRFIWEVNKDDYSINTINHIHEEGSITKKWFLFQKGGEFRRWFGNLYYVVNWQNDGEEIKNWVVNNPKDPKTTHWSRRVFNTNLYFLEGITWSTISSGKISFRFSEKGTMISNAAGGIFNFNKKEDLFFLLGVLNTKIWSELISFINPTLNYSSGIIQKTPSSKRLEIVGKIGEDLFTISKDDWNSHEIALDFQQHPLMLQYEQIMNSKNGNSLEESFDSWLKKNTNEYYQMHTYEERLNNIFIDFYGLYKEIDPIVPLKDISILQEELDRDALEVIYKDLRKHRQWKLEGGNWQLYIDDQLQPILAEGELPVPIVMPSLPIKKEVVMQQLISYAVGCMMGRYSLDAPGLILANQGETLDDYFRIIGCGDFQIAKKSANRNSQHPFLPDDDGIVPMMGSNCGFSDDAALRLRHFIEAVWGSETLTQNINFLQACLDMEIEKYLVNQNNFWKDHCSRYKKKPIYWLFSSKKGAFQVLVYMHRMNRFTVQKIRETYMFKHLQWLANQKSDLERRSATLSRDETRQLDYYRTALNECQEYDLQLKNIADQQIEFDLDDGVTVNYAKFELLLAAIK